MSRSTLTLLLFASSLGIASANERAPDAATLERLNALLVKGDCVALRSELKPLMEAAPRDPDLLTLEANCRLRDARRVSSEFDDQQYLRLKAGTGLEMLPASSTDLLHPAQISYSAEGLAGALELFDRALKSAPKRADLIAGNIAVKTISGRGSEAAQAIEEHAAAIDAAMLTDIAAAVNDAVGSGQLAAARAVTLELEKRFPGRMATLSSRAALATADRDQELLRNTLRAMTKLDPQNADLALRAARESFWSRRWDEVVESAVPFAAQRFDLKLLLAMARTRSSAASAAPLWAELASGNPADPNDDGYSKALISFFKERKYSEQPAATRIKLCRQLADKGLTPAALVLLDELFTGDPSLDGSLHIETGRALAQLYRSVMRFRDALAISDTLLKAIQEAPAGSVAFSSAELQGDRCALLFAIGNDKEALAACTLAREGGHAQWLLQADVALALGDKQEARAVLQEAVRAGGEIGGQAKARLELLK